MLDRIKFNFSESIHTKINTADTLSEVIALAAERIIQCLLEGHKILCCGNGGSATDALHFTSSMLNRFKYERPSLPAISLNSDIATLTSIANDAGFDEVFAKQLKALGQQGDLLLALSTSGNSANMINAVKAAHDKNISVIALTGIDGGKISETLLNTDVEVRVPSNDVSRIQETHQLIIHCICDVVDCSLFGHGEVLT